MPEQVFQVVDNTEHGLLGGVDWQADTEAHRSRIHMAQVLAEREAEQKQEAIQDEIMLARRRAEADADFYRCTHTPSAASEHAGGRVITTVASPVTNCAPVVKGPM